MDPIEQQIEIAKACGWREAFPSSGPAHPGTRKGGIMLPYTWINEVDGRRTQDLPNYLHDLNAMHEAEMLLRGEALATYSKYLLEIRSRDCTEPNEYDIPLEDRCTKLELIAIVAHATAAQRAEAFLRTIGKWKE